MKDMADYMTWTRNKCDGIESLLSGHDVIQHTGAIQPCSHLLMDRHIRTHALHTHGIRVGEKEEKRSTSILILVQSEAETLL